MALIAGVVDFNIPAGAPSIVDPKVQPREEMKEIGVGRPIQGFSAVKRSPQLPHSL